MHAWKWINKRSKWALETGLGGWPCKMGPKIERMKPKDRRKLAGTRAPAHLLCSCHVRIQTSLKSQDPDPPSFLLVNVGETALATIVFIQSGWPWRYLIPSGLAWVFFSHFLDPSDTTSLHENWHGFRHINISMPFSLIKVQHPSCLFFTFNQTMSLYHLGFLGLYLITCLYNMLRY